MTIPRTIGAAAVLTATSLASAAVQAQAYMEIVVFQTAGAEDFDTVRQDMLLAAHAEMPGLVYWLALDGEGDTRADVVLWETPEDARAAAKRSQVDPAFAPFVATISSVDHFMLYRTDATPEDLVAALETAPLVETALYDVIDAEAFNSAQADFHTLFDMRPVPLAAYRLDADENPRTHGDLIVWPDRASWEEAGAELTAMPAFAPMFENMETPHVFTLFEPSAVMENR